MAVYDAIIIGAGAAGLAAAKTISDAGRTILLLEARDRIGGRIHTVHDHATQIPIELGAEFIHGAPDPTMNAIRATKLTAYEVAFEHRVFRRGRLVRADDFSEQLSRVMGGLNHLRGRDISFAEYLRRHLSGRALAEPRRRAVAFVEGFDAADPERISARSLAKEQEDLGDVGEEPQYRLVQGYGALCDRLAAGLPSARAELRLGTQVSLIRWTPRGRGRGVECRTAQGRTFRARAAIVTLPLGILHLSPGRPGAVGFEPAIPGHLRAAAALASGPVVKVVLSFREPFWEELARGGECLRDLSLFHDPDGPFPAWWTQRPLRLPTLTAWAGGPKAQALTNLPCATLAETSLRALGRLLGLRPKQLGGLLTGAHASDWGADPFARGAYSYETVGASRARAALARPLGGVLYFAGEAADTSGQASTVAGALASGERAARALLRRP